jgi:uncharacterized protein YjbJ (UPF0337 family)
MSDIGLELPARRRRGASVSNEDKARNKAQDVKGKAKEGIGKATDDKETEREGKADQAKADLKQAGEKVKDSVKH